MLDIVNLWRMADASVRLAQQGFCRTSRSRLTAFDRIRVLILEMPRVVAEAMKAIDVSRSAVEFKLVFNLLATDGPIAESTTCAAASASPYGKRCTARQSAIGDTSLSFGAQRFLIE